MQGQSEKIAEIIKRCKKSFFYVIIFSMLINILMLTLPIYMLQVFDRVLASQSYDTLIYLTVIAIIAIFVYGILEMVRGKILVEVSRWVDNKLSPEVLVRGVDSILEGSPYGYNALKDVNTVKSFLSSPSIFAFFDMPWVPVYLFVIYVLHVVLGVFATIGALILFGFAVLHSVISDKTLSEANQKQADNSQYMSSALGHAETLQAMGMVHGFVKKWYIKNQEVLKLQSVASDKVGMVSSASKFFRMALQLIMMAVGAYLAMKGLMTSGAMIASSIILGRALAPVEQSLSVWKMFVSTRSAYKRLKQFVSAPSSRNSSTELPKAEGNLECENLIYMPKGLEEPLLQGINFRISAGEGLAIIGSSGAGKSTLARLILGVWHPTRGHIRLDGADVYSWDRADFGKQVGYLPQDTGLFHGTVKENISCMEADVLDHDVIAAAKMADVHEMILHLPHGYDSKAGGFTLSGGQAKRVALARAFYKLPCLVVLDEPETNLDDVGEKALLTAIRNLKNEKKSTIIVVTRRPHIIEMMDKTLLLADGRMVDFGPTREVIQRLSGKREVQNEPQK